MGVRVTIAGKIYEAENYSVEEDSTPTSSDDSTGSVGTISFDFVGIENPLLLQGEEVYLADSRKGSTLGFVSSINETDNGRVSIQCQSRLGRLNIFGVQAQPYVGTLGGAFRYYAELAGQIADVLVDEAIEHDPVSFPGWHGELWYNLKQLASSQGCEVALVSGVILLRPLRTRYAVDHRNVARNRSYGGGTLAKAVEVVCYNNTPITNQLVYPPEGWTPETEVITVGAGEEIERTLELSASISSFQAPVMQTFVAQNYNASSVYTIVGDDGLPIQPTQWADYGGRLEISIGEDTTSLDIKFRGAEGIISAKGEPISTFSLALGADFTGNRYSTLRIVGTGVRFRKETIRVRTLVPDQLTGTEVGITIDNPFISNLDQAYQAGVRAAKVYAGEGISIGGEVTSINRLGDSGSVAYPAYSYDQSQHAGRTYAQVATANAGKRYSQIQDTYFELVRNQFDNQLFGNVGGVRVWDRKTLRWYRVRRGGITPATISFDAEDDLVYGDLQGLYNGSSYDDVSSYFVGDSYTIRDRRGMYVADFSGLPEGAFPSLLNFPALDNFPQGV